MVYAMEPAVSGAPERAAVYFCDRFRRYRFDAAAGGLASRGQHCHIDRK